MKKTSPARNICTAIATLAAAAILVIPTAAFATPSDPPPSDEVSAERYVLSVPVYANEPGATSSDSTAEKSSAELVCQANAFGDYPHISTSVPGSPLATQSHGGWEKGTCAATQADVTTQLDRKNPIGLFQAVGTPGTGRLNSQADLGLPSGNRVTARYECNGVANAPFRAWTSIEMVGLDTFSPPVYTPPTGDIACG